MCSSGLQQGEGGARHNHPGSILESENKDISFHLVEKHLYPPPSTLSPPSALHPLSTLRPPPFLHPPPSSLPPPSALHSGTHVAPDLLRMPGPAGGERLRDRHMAPSDPAIAAASDLLRMPSIASNGETAVA